MAFSPPERPPGARSAQADLFARPASRAPGVLTVTELTRQLKATIEPRFAHVAIRGEISNYRPSSAGHVYFTLKDAGACLSAVLFRTDASRLKFAMKDGLMVIARGRLSVYDARGQYQIVCEGLEPEGAGALALAFEQLKAKLAKEGLFEPARKRPIPFLPRRIGVVTSPSGAALQDFLRVLHDRFPIPVLIAPARVQGEGAAAEVARAVARLSASGLVDVIVVTRGGGSIEDLWAFNEEVLARAVAASRVPVVSAVGHETDFTICDFVADKRCATPTDAAKTLAPARVDLVRALDQHRRHLRQIALRQIGLRRERLQHRAARLGDPRRLISEGRLELARLSERLESALADRLSARRAGLAALGQRLSREHPHNRLLRLLKVLGALEQELSAEARARMARERERLEGLRRRLAAASPSPRLARLHRDLGARRERLEKATARKLAADRLRLSRCAAGLQSLSPLAVLSRGYSITFLGNAVLRTASQAAAGATIRVLLSDRSELPARVLPAREASGSGSAGREGGGGTGG